MNSLAIVAIEAQKLHGYAQPLSEVSSAGEYKVEQNSADGVVYMTQDGGAWLPIQVGPPAVVTLQSAYTGGKTILLSASTPIALSTDTASGSSGITYTSSATQTSSSVAYTAARIVSAAPSSIYTGGGISILNMPTIGGFGVASTESGALISVTHSPIYVGTLSIDTTIGIRATLTSSLPIGSLTAALFTIGPGATNTATCLRCDYRVTAGTFFGNGIINVEVGALTSLSGQLVGIECDLITNVTGGSVNITGMRLQTAATTRANTAGEGAFVVDSRATAARVMDIGTRRTSGTMSIERWTAGTSLSGSTVVHDIDAVTNVTPGAQALTGLRIQTAATTRASNAGEGAVVIDSRGTLARVIDCSVRNTGTALGLICIRYGAAATLAAAVTGIHLDLTTNVTPGSQNVTGITVQVPGTSGNGTGVSIVSQSTAGSGVAIAMSPGSAATCVGLSIAMGSPTSGAAVTISHLGVADQDQLVFTTGASGTGAHIRGPATAALVMKAGIATGTAPGRAVTITAGDASTTGAGGGIDLNEGAGAGGSDRGTITIGSSTSAVLRFYGSGVGAVQAAAIPDASGGVVIDAEARAALNSLLAAMRAVALIAT